jgi:hypothetical protein
MLVGHAGGISPYQMRPLQVKTVKRVSINKSYDIVFEIRRGRSGWHVESDLPRGSTKEEAEEVYKSMFEVCWQAIIKEEAE